MSILFEQDIARALQNFTNDETSKTKFNAHSLHTMTTFKRLRDTTLASGFTKTKLTSSAVGATGKLNCRMMNDR
jgi:hypothetical protein